MYAKLDLGLPIGKHHVFKSSRAETQHFDHGTYIYALQGEVYVIKIQYGSFLDVYIYIYIDTALI